MFRVGIGHSHLMLKVAGCTSTLQEFCWWVKAQGCQLWKLHHVDLVQDTDKEKTNKKTGI